MEYNTVSACEHKFKASCLSRRIVDSYLDTAIGEMDEVWTDWWDWDKNTQGSRLVWGFKSAQHQRQFGLWLSLQGVENVLS